MRVLGIETSCDETSAAVLEGSGDVVALRSLVILSQDVHRIFGGVVPEIASRAHLTAIVPVVERALADASLRVQDVDAVAVTNAPGLVGALLVGVSYAKALAFGLGVPVVGVHHMEGHLFATALEHPGAVPPFIALLVSGGHTLLLDVEAWGRYRLLGRTRDDAAGEAFDKVAKLLGLPYPGGPHIERAARDAVGAGSNPYRFARPMLRRDQRPGDADYYDFSFSGLKTAVLNAVREVERDAGRGARDALVGGGRGEAGGATALEGTPRHELEGDPDRSDEPRVPRPSSPTASHLPPPASLFVAQAFQDALVDTLVEKTARAVEQFGRRRVVLGGGVAGNRTLVAALRARMAPLRAEVYAPTPRLATDNAAMIARAGIFHLECGERAGLDLNAFASHPLPGLIDA